MKASIFGRRMEVIPTRLREVCHDERYIINKPVSLNKLYLIWPQITMGREAVHQLPIFVCKRVKG